jgi:ribosomal protein S4
VVYSSDLIQVELPNGRRIRTDSRTEGRENAQAARRREESSAHAKTPRGWTESSRNSQGRRHFNRGTCRHSKQVEGLEQYLRGMNKIEGRFGHGAFASLSRLLDEINALEDRFAPLMTDEERAIIYGTDARFPAR